MVIETQTKPKDPFPLLLHTLSNAIYLTRLISSISIQILTISNFLRFIPLLANC